MSEDDEVGVKLNLKQKRETIAGLKETQTALKDTGKSADQASQDAEKSSRRWKTLDDRLSGVGATSKRAGKVGGALFQVLAQNSQGALGPVSDVYNKLQGIGSALDDSRTKAGKWVIGVGAAMTGVGAVLGTITSKEQTADAQLKAAIAGAGGNYEDFRKQIEKNIKTGEHYGNTAATTESVLNRLVLATRDPVKAFALYNSVLQISAARHKSVDLVALTVGRAINGQARGLNAFGFRLKDTNKLQNDLVTTQKDHSKALVEYNKAQQNLLDEEARIRAAHSKTGNNAIAVASAYIAVENATNAASAATFKYGKGSAQATLASQKLALAEARYGQVQSQSRSGTQLSVSEQISLRKAHEAVAEAQIRVRDTSKDTTKAQKDLAAAGSMVDQVNKQTAKYMSGQAAAAADTFTGHMHSLAAELDDKVAAAGSHVYGFLTAAGPAMMGLGAVIESGIGPKLFRFFLRITGVQKALDLLRTSELLAGDAALVTGAEVEAGSAAAAGAGVANFGRLAGAAAGVALAIGTYEVGKATAGSGAKGALATSLMGALSGAIIGLSVGGPFGAAVGGAIGLLVGLALHFKDAGSSADGMAGSVKQLGDNLKTSLALGGEQATSGVRSNLEQWLLAHPATAKQFKGAGITMDALIKYLASGGMDFGGVGSPLNRATTQYFTADGKVSYAAGTDLINKYLPQLLKAYGAAASAASAVTGMEGRAAGGAVFAGDKYKVGEAGWEYFEPWTDGYISSHQDSMVQTRNVSVPAAADSAGMERWGDEPLTLQVILDRKVLAEAVYHHTADGAARL